MTIENLMFSIAVSVPPVFVCAVIIKYLRRKERVARSGSIIEDPEALEAAQLQANSLNLRKELAKNHTLLDHFSSMQGYNDNYMDQLVTFMAGQNIDAHYLFQEAMPTGAITVTGPSGTYELYVPRGMEAQAKKLIADFRQI